MQCYWQFSVTHSLTNWPIHCFIQITGNKPALMYWQMQSGHAKWSDLRHSQFCVHWPCWPPDCLTQSNYCCLVCAKVQEFIYLKHILHLILHWILTANPHAKLELAIYLDGLSYILYWKQLPTFITITTQGIVHITTWLDQYWCHRNLHWFPQLM